MTDCLRALWAYLRHFEAAVLEDRAALLNKLRRDEVYHDGDLVFVYTPKLSSGLGRKFVPFGLARFLCYLSKAMS